MGLGCCGGNGIGDGSSEDNKNDDDSGNGDGGAIDLYYDAGNDSDNAGVFVVAARAAVDAAAAADRGDDDASCNEDPSVCAFPAATTTTSLLHVAGATPRQRAGPPLSGVVAYFSSSLDTKDKEEDNDNTFDDSNIVGREVGWQQERI